MSKKIVVVGGGQAGASLVAKLRALGHDGPVTLICDEPVPPYQRPPLSKKYLLGEMDLERLYLRPESFYVENEIELLTGASALSLDRDSKTVSVEGDNLPYDALALCTGSLPRRLPAAIGGDLGGVYTVRTLADVDRMAHEFASGRRALVVGGGYIGLEAAAVAASRGVKVTLVEQTDRILNRVASEATADFIRDLHQREGVSLKEGIGLAALKEHEGRVCGALLSDGTEIESDFVVVGIGIVPDTRLAEAADLKIDNGIAVDAACRTSDPDIYAAGDCASFPWGNGRLRLESVQNAIDQAEHAAAAMMGSEEPYRPYPWFWSDQFDCKLQIAGLNTGYKRVVTREGSRPGGQSVWYFADDTLLAVDAMNDPKAYMQAKRWIEAGQSPDPDQVGDPSLDLRKMI